MIKIASFNVENLYARPKAFRYTDIFLSAFNGPKSNTPFNRRP